MAPPFGSPKYLVPYYNRTPKGTIVLTTIHVLYSRCMGLTGVTVAEPLGLCTWVHKTLLITSAIGASSQAAPLSSACSRAIGLLGTALLTFVLRYLVRKSTAESTMCLPCAQRSLCCGHASLCKPLDLCACHDILCKP